MRIHLKMYRMLLRLYPAGFRDEYRAPLERQFRDDYADAVHTTGVGRLWLRVAMDFARSMPRQLIEQIRQDARHALRGWRRHPLAVAFAIATMAAGIGGSTGVFSVLNAVLLRSLPFGDADRLAAVLHFSPNAQNSEEFRSWYEQSAYLEDAARFSGMDSPISCSVAPWLAPTRSESGRRSAPAERVSCSNSSRRACCCRAPGPCSVW
jgi:putative ABC transport system permease protein